jgi:hypothetical protein
MINIASPQRFQHFAIHDRTAFMVRQSDYSGHVKSTAGVNGSAGECETALDLRVRVQDRVCRSQKSGACTVD